MTFALLRLYSEEPLMTLGILSPVTTLPERRIPKLLNDLCSSLPCRLEVFVNVDDINEKTLCGLAEFSRILIARAGAAHHYNVVAKHHGRVLDFATRILIRGAALPKPESLRQESLNGRYIFVIEIRNDCHGSSLCAFPFEEPLVCDSQSGPPSAIAVNSQRSLFARLRGTPLFWSDVRDRLRKYPAIT